MLHGDAVLGKLFPQPPILALKRNPTIANRVVKSKPIPISAQIQTKTSGQTNATMGTKTRWDTVHLASQMNPLAKVTQPATQLSPNSNLSPTTRGELVKLKWPVPATNLSLTRQSLGSNPKNPTNPRVLVLKEQGNAKANQEGPCVLGQGTANANQVGPCLGQGTANANQAGPCLGQGTANANQAGPCLVQGNANANQAGPCLGQGTKAIPKPSLKEGRGEPQGIVSVCGKPTYGTDTSLGRRSLGSIRKGPNPVVDNPNPSMNSIGTSEVGGGDDGVVGKACLGLNLGTDHPPTAEDVTMRHLAQKPCCSKSLAPQKANKIPLPLVAETAMINKCGNRSCKLCPYLLTDNSAMSKLSKRKHLVYGNMSCQTQRLVYLLQCFSHKKKLEATLASRSAPSS